MGSAIFGMDLSILEPWSDWSPRRYPRQSVAMLCETIEGLGAVFGAAVTWRLTGTEQTDAIGVINAVGVYTVGHVA